jgi:hypothetical protein
MRGLDRWIFRACERLDALPTPLAIASLAAACFGANMAIAFGILMPLIAAGVDLRLPSLSGLTSRGVLVAYLLAVLVGPFLETWLVQALGFLVARRWTGRPGPIIVAVGTAFAALHAIGAPGHGVAQVGGGLVLAFTFFWSSRRLPRPRPVLDTFLVHALNNLAAVTLYFAMRGLTR